MPRGSTTIDDFLLKVLEDGRPTTVNDIIFQLESCVRIKLEKLRVRGIVIREGRGGARREFTFRLVKPELAAKALVAKGGGLARRAATLD